jgi:hyperosmotically inducible periplasmic protein
MTPGGGISMATPEIRMVALLAILAGNYAALAQAPDNSATNKNPQTTAEQQSNAPADRAITQKIRKALVADKSLSIDASNVKIITTNGMVTLRGPVKSEAEKQNVAAKAAEVVDASKIDNQLTVKGD